MKKSDNAKGKSFTAFRSAAEEADTKRENDAMKQLEQRALPMDTESAMNDEDILARLKVIDRRLRQISTEEAASVLAGGLASAGLNEQERLRLIAETERMLDNLDGNCDN